MVNELQQQILKQLLEDELDLHCQDLLISKMSGGAIQENWSIQPAEDDQNWALVLRKNSATILETSSDREQEYRLLKSIYSKGIKVPKPLYFSKKDNFLDSDFFVMKKVYGRAEGHKLVRIQDLNQQRHIVQDIGRQLAKIHLIDQDAEIESFLKKPNSTDYLENALDDFVTQIDHLQRSQPVLEYAIQWMRQHLPTPQALCLVHGDFRTGNLMIDQGQVSGILDWEFTHWGDPREDIGWFTAKCWRFGQDQHVAGGMGHYADFMQAYAELTNHYIEEIELKFWHLHAHVRWAIIAMQQAHRNQGAEKPSLELALTDFFVPQLEKNILDILGVWR